MGTGGAVQWEPSGEGVPRHDPGCEPKVNAQKAASNPTVAVELTRNGSINGPLMLLSVFWGRAWVLQGLGDTVFTQIAQGQINPATGGAQTGPP